MLRRLKQFMPLPLRTRLKWLGYAAQDILGGARPSGVPPKRKTFIGGGDFVIVGSAFMKIFKRHGLAPEMDVLDVGCGQGRLARPLVGFLESGTYQGFDIDKSGIEWCQNEYADIAGFKFYHADVFNQRYNANGRIAAKDFRFPCADDGFDFIFLTSVFTHMFAEDIENYLSEITRVLKPGGKCLITWFLLDEISRQSGHPVYNFAYEVDEVSRTTLAANPEAAMAFDLDYVRDIYQKHGLEIQTIENGKWARPNSPYTLQDLIVAVK